MSGERPTIGITLGDPFGIGPEVVIKALADRALRRSARFVLYGQNAVLAWTAEQLRLEPFWFRVSIRSDRASEPIVNDVVVLDYDHHEIEPMAAPHSTRHGGAVSKACVEDAITDAMRPPSDCRAINAIVTGPISKESWAMAGFRWPGHTELLAARTRAPRHAMMFVSPRLRVALATTHIPLMDVRNVLTIGKVFDPIELGHHFCRNLGIEHPAIAVTGLNPHAGEGGLFGDEEERIIAPAIAMAREQRINATGPYPGDTIFIDAAAGKYDLVVAMYHDQGLIPVKLLGWDKAVNVTVGLPIIRTSPDHGTAFNIAGHARASEGSMRSAIELAMALARRRTPTSPTGSSAGSSAGADS